MGSFHQHVIPVYNEEARVLEALKRVIQQSFVKEILVIDDGSTDNSLSGGHIRHTNRGRSVD